MTIRPWIWPAVSGILFVALALAIISWPATSGLPWHPRHGRTHHARTSADRAKTALLRQEVAHHDNL